VIVVRRFLPALGLAAAAVMAVPLGAAPTPKAAAARDWSRAVAMTPEGGVRMGNPAARVKLVEYGSLTCPHCADFARTAMTPLVANHIKTGRVSFEYRNYVLNGIDVTATLLARCGGPQKFFPIAEALYATQPTWVGRISGLPQAQKDQLKTLATGERLSRLADIGGLTQLAAQKGVPLAQGKKCLADQVALDRLTTMYEAAVNLGVTRTPTFFVNGARVHAGDWATLEPLILQAQAR
jgi:protein-disulfide isomerase